jgi:LemA protein
MFLKTGGLPIMNRLLVAGVVALVAVAVLAGVGVGQYNGLVKDQQAVSQSWSQVENVYQRRADLVPNLVAVVQGAAGFEKNTLTAVTEARAKAGQMAAGVAPTDPAAMQRFEAAQAELSSALSRLMVVVENYPELKATQGFLELQTQLAGAENRILVERGRFNDAAKGYNTHLQSVPGAWFVKLLGWKFEPRPYFAASEGAQNAPGVKL